MGIQNVTLYYFLEEEIIVADNMQNSVRKSKTKPAILSGAYTVFLRTLKLRLGLYCNFNMAVFSQLLQAVFFYK